MSILDSFPIVIAEIGGNAAGEMDLAKRMIQAAVDAGTPYVKFQTYQVERLVSRAHPGFETLSSEGFSFDQFRELKSFCDEVGASFLSTAFDPDAVALLDKLDVPAIKIASGDLTYHELLRSAAETGRPVLLSTGGATIEEIDRAVNVVQECPDTPLVLLHCTSAYPCPDPEANLRVMTTLSQRFACPVGFSDHTVGIVGSLAGVALGALVIEKHFTIDQSLPGGDNDISILPGEMSDLLSGINRIVSCLGSPEKVKTETEERVDVRMHRSLIARVSIEEGHVLVDGDLDAVRPADGIPAADWREVRGKKTKRAFGAGESLTLSDLE
jgi:N,N'-diacetyllegionaminate synthase